MRERTSQRRGKAAFGRAAKGLLAALSRRKRPLRDRRLADIRAPNIRRCRSVGYWNLSRPGARLRLRLLIKLPR